MKSQYNRRIDSGFLVAAILIFAMVISLVQAGCGTTPKKEEKPTYIFYPAPPDEPRFQFLTSYKTAADMGAMKRTGFAEHVLGAEADAQIQKIERPYGVAMRDGRIYVCDIEDGVVNILDLAKREFSRIGSGPAGKLQRPANIYVDTDGKKYVADRGWNRVLIYDENDEYYDVFGDPEKMGPVDVLVLDDDVYVVDFSENEIEIWDKKTRKYKGVLGESIGEPVFFARPLSIAVDEQRNFYVMESFGFKITVLDEEGHMLRSIGDIGDNPGQFARPKGIALDREGRVYSVDAAFNNIQVFDNTGQILTYIGSGGDGPGQLILPAEIAVDYEDIELFKKYVHPRYDLKFIILVTSQFGPRSVSVYGFISPKQ